MKIHHTLRKHYGASGLLLVGLLICSYAFWQLQKIPHVSSPEIKTETTPTTTSVISKTNPTVLPQKAEPKSESKTSTTATTTTIVAETIPVTITIAGQEYPVNVAPSSTVYTAMRALSDTATISVTYKNFSGLGYFVEAINGQAGDTIQAKYWIYYINGRKATRGISQVQLNSNDVISWKYENAE